MSQISERLKTVKYQVIKNLGYSLSDKQKIEAVQSIYDAAINSGFTLPAGESLPTTVLGTTITWSDDKTEFVVKLNDTIIDDTLTDTVVPDVDSFANWLFVNEQAFLVNGDNLELNVK